MSKKSIIAVLSAVVLMVVASLTLVFTVGPKTSADSEEIYLVPTEYLTFINNGKILGNGSGEGNAFNAEGKTWIQNHAKYYVEIPAGVTSIANYAFNGCSGLTSITIPESVTSIGDPAFAACSSLTSMTVNSNNTKYTSQDNEGHECNCIVEKSSNKLICGCQSTIIPEGVTSIGDSAFSRCSSLTSITIPEGVTSIGNCAFSGCSGLTSITIPEGVTSIGGSAFYGCSGLTSITIPDGVTSISIEAFDGCRSLTSITIPNSVTSIGLDAFSGCRSLTSITIPNSVTSIGGGAFRSCRGLTSITIPSSVTSIGKDAFIACSGLNEIIVRKPSLMTNTNLQSYASKLHYGADKNTVSFVTNCDTTFDSRLIDFGGVTPEPTITLTKEHYTFAGWYSDKQYTKPFTFDTPIKYDITLYAKWDADKFTVTFESNGGSIVNSRQVDYGTTTTSPRPSRTGYKLLGWKLNGVTFDFANTPITEDITLVAEWEKLCVVTFDSNGGSEVATQYIENNKYASFPQGVSKQYYNLVGWKLNGETFDFASTPITEDITLVADWAIYTYEVTFNSNGGTSVSKQTVDHSAKVMIPTDPTRDGYFFCGWYLVGTNSATEYDFETPVTKKITLTAVWKKIYNVTFANANGEVYTTRAVVEGDLVQAPDITVDGYLVSWYAGDKAYDFTTPVTADMTLTAQLDENSVRVNNQNNNALIWGIAGTAAGILVIGGLVTGIVIAKRRRK